MKKIVILFGVVAVFAAFGCAPKEEATSTETGTDPVVEKPAGETEGMELAAYRNEDGNLECPVMGNEIASEDAAVGHSDYEGTRYYFCCGGCPDAFDKNPEKYAMVEDE
jgi:YHS domain-containing protein